MLSCWMLPSPPVRRAPPPPSMKSWAARSLREDVGLSLARGRELEDPLPRADSAEQDLIEAMNRGLGDKCAYTATFRLQEEAANVVVRATGVEPEKAGKYISTHPEE